jgi:hypothetical protein
MKRVIKVKPMDLKLVCEFNDGKIIEYDMSYIQEEKGPMVDPLKEEEFFNQVFVQDGDVIWPNGYDLNPEVIYR